MTLHPKAKEFHYRQIQRKKDEKKMTVRDFSNQFSVVICDVMKAYYSMTYRSTWAEMANDLLNSFKQYTGKHGGVLILVADLYRTPNQYRELVATTRRESAAARKPRKPKAGEPPKPASETVLVPSPEKGKTYESPPSDLDFHCYLHNSDWKTMVILPSIGRELRKVRLDNTALVIRGFCHEPEEISDPETFDKRKSYGTVWWSPPSEEHEKKGKVCKVFDEIATPGTAEADLATVSFAYALTKYHAKLLPYLCESLEFSGGDDTPPHILMVSGDGDAHTINMMMAAKYRLDNIFIGVLNVDWSIPCVYSALEAARELPDKKFGELGYYVYCALIYLCGCDYTEKIHAVSSEGIDNSIIPFFNNRNRSSNLYTKGSPLVAYRDRLSSDVSPSTMVQLDDELGLPVLSHLAWCSLILASEGCSVTRCHCLPDSPRACEDIYSGRSEEGITLHYLISIVAGLESTLRYFSSEWDPRQPSVALELTETCGYYRDRAGVHFGMRPLTPEFEKGMEHFLKIIY